MLPIMIFEIEEEKDRDFLINIYLDYYPIMKKNTLSIIKDINMVEDIIHDTIVRLLPKIKMIRNLECYKLTSYIVKTNKSIAINYFNKRKSQSNKMYYGMEEDIAVNIVDYKINIEDIICTNEKIDELSSAIERLSERDRDLLYFKYILEMSDEEIGKTLAVNVRNIRQYLARARKRALKEINKEVELSEQR